jgi:ubiquinone/menaquinone biosynthesis C-methylase UbiE
LSEAYKNSARYYDIFVEPFNVILRKIGYKMHLGKPGLNVLEVGCGTATNLLRYRDAGCTVYGLDRSPWMLLESRKKLGHSGKFCRANAENVPYKDSCFDLAITMLTLLKSSPPAVISKNKITAL